MCLRKLAIVDDTLEALGSPKEYQRLRNWIIRIIIGMIVYVFCELAYINILSFNYLSYVTMIWHLTLTFLDIYPTYITMLSSFISAALFGLVLYMCTHFVSYFY